MSQKHNYEVIVGNVGTMSYTSKKLAVDCFKTYRTISKQGVTKAANEPVTLMKDGRIIDEYTPRPVNLIAKMFDIEEVKKRIANCPTDEMVILCNNWSINCPTYPDSADPEHQDWDFQELEDTLDTTLIVTDYNDLAADPHGIYNA